MNLEWIYNTLVNDQNNPVGLEFNEEKSIKMKNHFHPWSIKHKEFMFLYNTIKQNNLKKGYEVATAFGISSLAAGLAMKETGGKIVTMDAYIEEKFNNSHAYQNIYNVVFHQDTDGYKNIKYLIEKFKLENEIFPEVGWSPNDTYSVLSKHYNLNEEKLDYIFIDAAHWDSAVINDIDSVYPYLDDNCYVFFHDVHGFTEVFTDHLRKRFNKIYDIVVPVPDGFNLSLLIK